jgi:uncharacterized membrane protein HdeD (DUF308 family)
MSEESVSTASAESVSSTLKKVSGLLMVLGIAQIVIGSICIMAPLFTSVALVKLIGILLLVAGVVETIQAIQSRGFGAGGAGFLGGVLGIVGGILIFIAPWIMLSFISLLVAIYFFADGIQRVSLAWTLKPADGWGWVMFGGVIGLLLGTLMITGWPGTGAVFIGLMVGIRILFRGWAALMIALAARRA